MMVSTKGRYALRVMLDLAMQKPEQYISLNDIAKRQQISMKYLEAIVALLNKAGILQSRRGKDGGYRLARSPKEYPVSEILKLTEGTLSPVACMEEEGCGPDCGLLANCLTRPMWNKLDSIIDAYLSSVSLQDLLDGRC
ncbi:MAG: RrF2 family transcriptional regulator [Eubacteriales bacterium]|nr:RrF2 family transcriptional regulator [Eubacteriales bacterium]